MRDYGRKILERAIDDDTRFYFIAEPDEGDDPWELETWQKANPNLGISIRLEDFRSTADTARQMPTSRNEFLRKRLNIWTKVRTLAINMEDWNTCSDHVDEAALAGRDCYGGLDLSMRGDLTAFALLFPPLAPDEKWQLLCRCWIPENTVAAKEKTDRVLYSHWIQQGLLIATEGDRQNYAEVRRQIVADCAAFNVLMIAFDRWNAEETRQLLEAEGVQMREFDQTIRGYNEPTQRFLRMVQNHELAHGGNSLLKWCASNLEVKTDHNQNVRPVKPDYRQTARIDPIVATIMAVGEAIRSAQTANYLSIL
jgi:phage terminase large subunit-like protein